MGTSSCNASQLPHFLRVVFFPFFPLGLVHRFLIGYVTAQWHAVIRGLILVQKMSCRQAA